MKRFAIIAALIVTSFGSVTNAEAVINLDPETGSVDDLRRGVAWTRSCPRCRMLQDVGGSR
jgi:hypothetical protein